MATATYKGTTHILCLHSMYLNYCYERFSCQIFSKIPLYDQCFSIKNLNQKQQLKAFINALSGEPWGSSCYEVQSKADALTLSLKLTWLESL